MIAASQPFSAYVCCPTFLLYYVHSLQPARPARFPLLCPTFLYSTTSIIPCRRPRTPASPQAPRMGAHKTDKSMHNHTITNSNYTNAQCTNVPGRYPNQAVLRRAWIAALRRSSAVMLGAALLVTLLAPVQGWAVASKFDVKSKLPLTPALRTATDEKLGKQVCRPGAVPALRVLCAGWSLPGTCPPHSSPRRARSWTGTTST